MRQSWDSRETVLRQSWDSPETVMRQSWNSHETVMKQSWDSHETVMRQSWDSPETVYYSTPVAGFADMSVLVCSVRSQSVSHPTGGHMTMACHSGKGHGKKSLLRRLQTQTLPNATPPLGKISLFTKIAVTFEPTKRFRCPSRFRVS